MDPLSLAKAVHCARHRIACLDLPREQRPDCLWTDTRPHERWRAGRLVGEFGEPAGVCRCGECGGSGRVGLNGACPACGGGCFVLSEVR